MEPVFELAVMNFRNNLKVTVTTLLISVWTRRGHHVSCTFLRERVLSYHKVLSYDGSM